MENNFSHRLQLLIDMIGVKQRDFAEAMQVHEARVSEWLSGKIKTPRRPTIIKIATYFGCDFEWLRTGKGQIFANHSEKLLPDGRRILTAISPQPYSLQGDEKVGGDKVLTASQGSAAISAGGQVTNTQQGNQPSKVIETDELSAMEKTFLQILRRRPDGEELLEHYLSEVLKPYGN